MLEAAIVLEVALGKYVEAAIIAALLAFNAALGFFQKGRAQATLAALKSRFALNASVRRDNVWGSWRAFIKRDVPSRQSTNDSSSSTLPPRR